MEAAETLPHTAFQPAKAALPPKRHTRDVLAALRHWRAIVFYQQSSSLLFRSKCVGLSALCVGEALTQPCAFAGFCLCCAAVSRYPIGRNSGKNRVCWRLCRSRALVMCRQRRVGLCIGLVRAGRSLKRGTERSGVEAKPVVSVTETRNGAKRSGGEAQRTAFT